MAFRLTQTSSGRIAEPSSSTSADASLSVTTPRTSSKRSFDEYGQLESHAVAGPSASASTSSGMMPHSSSSPYHVGTGAATLSVFPTAAGIVDPLGNASSGTQNPRHKRRRGRTASSDVAVDQQPVPPLPAASSSTAPAGPSNQRLTRHSTSDSIDSVMSWTGESTSDHLPQMPTPMPSRNENDARSFVPQFPFPSVYPANTPRPFSRTNGDALDNRMSWLPEPDTVTTNTEPGWDLTTINSSQSYPFPTPPVMNSQIPSSSQLDINYSMSSYGSSGQSANFPSSTSNVNTAFPGISSELVSNTIRPQPGHSFHNLTYDHDLAPGNPQTASPPPATRPSLPSPLTPSEPSSWWSLRWGQRGAASSTTSPPPVPPRPNVESRPRHSHRRIYSSEETSARNTSSGYRRNGNELIFDAPSSTRPNYEAPSRRLEDSQWPPYSIPTPMSSGPLPTSSFSPPYDLGTWADERTPRAQQNIPLRSSFDGHLGTSWSETPPAESMSRPPRASVYDPTMFPTPMIRPPPSLHRLNSNRLDRPLEPPAEPNSRRPAPSPETRRSIASLQDIMDRHAAARRTVNTDVDGAGRQSTRRSSGDDTPSGSRHSRSHTEIDLAQRRTQRLENWRDQLFSGASPFIGDDGSITPPRSTARTTPSFYDHPSMQNLMMNHSSNVLERERQDVHSTLSRAAIPPPSRRLPAASQSNVSTSLQVPETPTRSGGFFSNLLQATSRAAPSRPIGSPPPRRTSGPTSGLWGETSERPAAERRTDSARSRNARRRRERMAEQTLAAERPHHWLGIDDDDLSLFYDAYGMDDDFGGGFGLATMERMRQFARSRPGRLARLGLSRTRPMGDYMMDDDFDDSYEALLALGQFVGQVKRGCSEETLKELPHGTYAEFSAGAPSDSETKVVGDNGNCAICLEDYKPEDICTKLPRCSHFYHQDCVKEWLKTSKTCPVCRGNVEGTPRPEPGPSRPRFVPISDEDRESSELERAPSRPSNSTGPVTSIRGLRMRSFPSAHPLPPPPPSSFFDDLSRDRPRESTEARLERLWNQPFNQPTPLPDYEDEWPSEPSAIDLGLPGTFLYGPSRRSFRRRSPSPPPRSHATGASRRPEYLARAMAALDEMAPTIQPSVGQHRF